MPSLTLQDIRDYSRTYTDTDELDLPNNLVDAWAQEGFNKIAYGRRHWNFYDITFDFNTVAGTQSYSLAAGGINANQIVEIDTIHYDNYFVNPIDHRHAQKKFLPNTNTGNPTYWSKRDNKIWLWRIPGSVLAITVSAYRAPADWIADGSGGTPDLPTEFHPFIRDYVAMKALYHEDDIEMAQAMEAQFLDGVARVEDRYTESIAAGPMILNSGGSTSDSGLPNRLIYDWE